MPPVTLAEIVDPLRFIKLTALIVIDPPAPVVDSVVTLPLVLWIVFASSIVTEPAFPSFAVAEIDALLRVMVRPDTLMSPPCPPPSALVRSELFVMVTAFAGEASP